MPLRFDMEPKDYLKIIVKNKWLIIFSFLIIFTGVFWYLVLTTDKYKSKTTILIIPQSIPDSFARSGSSAWIESRLNTLQQLITSRSRLMQVVTEYGLNKGVKGKIDEEIVVEKMRMRIEVTINRRDAFNISFYHEDPLIAMLVTKRLASFFMEENLKEYQEQSAQTEDFLATRLAEVKRSLEEREGKIRAYRFKYMDELPQQVEVNLGRIRQLEIQQKAAIDSIRTLEEKKAQLSVRDQTLQRSIYAIIQDNDVFDSNTPGATNPASLQQMSPVAAKRARLNELLARYTESYPEVVRLRQELAQLEGGNDDDAKTVKPSKPVDAGKTNRSVASYSRLLSPDPEERVFIRGEISKINKEIKKFNDQLKEIQENIKQYQAKIVRAPQHEQEMMYLTRDYDHVRVTYNDLLSKTLSLDMSQAMNKRREGDHFQILDPANLPKTSFSPNVVKILQLAFIASFGLGILVVFGLEILNSKISGVKDFKHYSELPVLATFPVIKDMGFYYNRKKWEKYAIIGGLASFTISFTMLVYLHAPKMKKIFYSIGSLL